MGEQLDFWSKPRANREDAIASYQRGSLQLLEETLPVKSIELQSTFELWTLSHVATQAFVTTSFTC